MRLDMRMTADKTLPYRPLKPKSLSAESDGVFRIFVLSDDRAITCGWEVSVVRFDNTTELQVQRIAHQGHGLLPQEVIFTDAQPTQERSTVPA